MLLAVNYVFAFVVLACASYHDFKAREVSDVVWYVGFPVGLALDAVNILSGGLQLVQLAISVAVSLPLGFLPFFLGLIAEADVLALLFIGLATPAYPDFFPLVKGIVDVPVFAAFCNATVVSLAYPATVFVLNVADLLAGKNPFKSVEINGIGDILVLFFTTRRVSLDKVLNGLHYFPAERLEFEGERVLRRPVYFTRAEADLSDLTEKIVEHRDVYRDGILASPTIPMTVFLVFGLALTLLGNVVFMAISAIIRR